MTDGTYRYLAVIDPTRNDQWALRKAIEVAKDREGATVYALLCVFSNLEAADVAELQEAEVRRNSLWLDAVIENLNGEVVTVEPVVVWNDDWREAIAVAATDNEVDLVIKRASGRPNALASSDRQLIRTLESAILLVKHDPSRELNKVVVAVDFNATDDDHAALNDAIMDIGRRIHGASEEMELHSVSAYPDSDKFVHPPDIAKKLDIDRSRAHVRRGSAADVIPDLANDIDADLVIVGNVGRRGLSGITVGNTAEKILTDIHSDVLVLVREKKGDESASAA